MRRTPSAAQEVLSPALPMVWSGGGVCGGMGSTEGMVVGVCRA